jgi:hypothetical protein
MEKTMASAPECRSNGRFAAYLPRSIRILLLSASLLLLPASRIEGGNFQAGDIDRSGGIDAVDVQTLVNAALGLSFSGQANLDFDFAGFVNAVDVQLVINAALGLIIDSDGDGISNAGETNLGTDPASTTHTNDGSIIGTNLSLPADFSAEFIFIDAFKTSREWISGTILEFDDGRSIDQDANGWVRSLLPEQIARTLMFWELTDRYPAGTYIVLYEGSGVIEYRFAATKDEDASAPGRDVITVDPSVGGIELDIVETNPQNYIRNIRVIMPGGSSPEAPFQWFVDAEHSPFKSFVPFEESFDELVFHPAFLASIRNYKLIRFMDWMYTNGSTQEDFADRPVVTAARWSETGIPLEIMCLLANRLHADPWFNIPHRATDDYISKVAALIRDRVVPGLNVHVEYSNEVWNSIFEQQAYAMEQGLAQELDPDAFTAAILFYSQRTVDVMTIFEEVFGGADRLVRVMGSQAPNTGISSDELLFNNAAAHIDALAIAPYFGGEFGSPENEGTTAAMSLDELFKQMEATSLPDAISTMTAQAATAAKFNVRLISYEGGQHLAGVGPAQSNAAINTLFDAANRDPRMGEIYSAYLEAWTQATDGIFVHYLNCLGYSEFGRWGALEFLEQPREEAPKFDAIQTFIDANRP